MPETDTIPSGQPETTPKPLENDAHVTDASLQEQLKKERQERMAQNAELNRLREEKKKREDTDAAAERKRLEENGEALELARREKDRADAAEKALTDREKSEALQKGTAEIFAKYPNTIKKVAQTAGLSLLDDTEEAKTALTEKMDAIAKDINGNQRVRGNNMPPQEQQTDPNRATALKKLKFGDKSQETMHELLKDNPGIVGMKRLYENAQINPNG